MTKLPYFFLEKLKELNINTINVHPDDSFYFFPKNMKKIPKKMLDSLGRGEGIYTIK